MNKLYKRWIVVGIGYFILLPVYAQDIKKMTVAESVQLGLAHNFKIKAAGASVDEAEADYQLAKSGRLPLVQGQASYMRLSNNIPSVDFSFPGMDTTYTLLPVELNQFYSELSVKQLLFGGGQLNRQIKAAGHRAEAARLMEQQERADVAFNIRKAYWELYQALALTEALESALQLVEAHLVDVENKMREGTLLRTELLNAKVRRSEILLERLEAKSRVEIARLSLNRLTGQPEDLIVTLDEPRPAGSFPISMVDLEEQTLQNRPELTALSEQVSSQETEVGIVKSQRLPEVSLVARYIYARPNQYFFAEQDRFNGTWEAGVAIHWNIWAGGKRLIEADRATARLQSTEARLADKKEQATIEVAQIYLEMERSAVAIELATENVKSAEEAFRLTKNQFEEGVVLSTQLLDAQHAFRKAQANYARVVADFELAQASLLHKTGQIWNNDEK